MIYLSASQGDIPSILNWLACNPNDLQHFVQFAFQKKQWTVLEALSKCDQFEFPLNFWSLCPQDTFLRMFAFVSTNQKEIATTVVLQGLCRFPVSCFYLDEIQHFMQPVSLFKFHRQCATFSKQDISITQQKGHVIVIHVSQMIETTFDLFHVWKHCCLQTAITFFHTFCTITIYTGKSRLCISWMRQCAMTQHIDYTSLCLFLVDLVNAGKTEKAQAWMMLCKLDASCLDCYVCSPHSKQIDQTTHLLLSLCHQGFFDTLLFVHSHIPHVFSTILQEIQTILVSTICSQKKHVDDTHLLKLFSLLDPTLLSSTDLASMIKQGYEEVVFQRITANPVDCKDIMKSICLYSTCDWFERFKPLAHVDDFLSYACKNKDLSIAIQHADQLKQTDFFAIIDKLDHVNTTIPELEQCFQLLHVWKEKISLESFLDFFSQIESKLDRFLALCDVEKANCLRVFFLPAFASHPAYFNIAIALQPKSFVKKWVEMFCSNRFNIVDPQSKSITSSCQVIGLQQTKEQAFETCISICPSFFFDLSDEQNCVRLISEMLAIDFSNQLTLNVLWHTPLDVLFHWFNNNHLSNVFRIKNILSTDRYTTQRDQLRLVWLKQFKRMVELKRWFTFIDTPSELCCICYTNQHLVKSRCNHTYCFDCVELNCPKNCCVCQKMMIL